MIRLASCAALAVLTIHLPAHAQQPIRIGMASSFVTEQPQVFVSIAVNEFMVVTKDLTGLKSDVSAKHPAAELAGKLDGKQLDFAMLYAHEFAWAKQKHPELRPLLIAATKQMDKRVHVVVPKDSPAQSFSDLRGKKLDLPLRSKEYCRLYLDKSCAGEKNGPAGFFGSIVKSSAPVAALDQVARKDADATVIDTPLLDFYKDVKGPVFDKNLRVLTQSSVVPPAVLAYKPGGVNAATVDLVRSGLRKANTTVRGRALLGLWHVESFEPVPEDYDRSLATLLKEYPSPR